MKSTCSFYDFDPEKRREYEELCATLPFPVDGNEPPSSILFDFGNHIFSLSTNFCRHFKITGEKTPSHTLTAVARLVTNMSSGSLTQIRGGRPARLPLPLPLTNK